MLLSELIQLTLVGITLEPVIAAVTSPNLSQKLELLSALIPLTTIQSLRFLRSSNS